VNKFRDRVCLNNFSIEDIDVSEIDRISDYLPRNGVIDINIAESALALTLEGQNLCQEKIAQVDRWIGIKETDKNKAWSYAALTLAKAAGIKTAKEKEWFAQSDADYINAYNDLTLAKACKRWFENKASYFQTWHYALKTFLKRDYSIENISGISTSAYNVSSRLNRRVESESDEEDMCGDVEWK
jgi:hypothetical protein